MQKKSQAKKKLIRTMMIMRGITYRDIAKAAGVTESTVRTVVNGFRRSKNVDKAVNLLLNLD